MNAIITIAIGTEFEQIANLTHPLIEGYARRTRADFISLHGSVTRPWFEKFRLFDFLGIYDRVLFLDSDVIVRPDCPNLFEIVPSERLGAWVVSEHKSGFAPLIARIQDTLPNIGWKKTYFNTGVMVVSRSHRDAFAAPVDYEDEQYDQTLLNYRVQKLGYLLFDSNCSPWGDGTQRVTWPAGAV